MERLSQGFTIIEVAITTFIIGTVVVGLFGLFFLSLRSSQESERRIVAVALANERMEMVRNLPYVNVGTQGGVPAGTVSQNETITRNGVPYTVRTDIRYVDDPYDGESLGSNQNDQKVTVCHKPGTASEKTLVVSASALNAHLAHGDHTGSCGAGGQGTNGQDQYNADYKQARVEVSWNSASSAAPVLLITYVTPQGVEGGELGGTLDFQALSASGEGIPDANVTLVNDQVTPHINLTTQTNSEGHLVLPGLPASSGTYKLTVGTSDYTSEQTYDTTSTFIPDPEHSHLSMILREVTNKTFLIDHTSSLAVTTKEDTLSHAVLPNIAYTLRGTKTIGVDNQNKPVYVVNQSASTNSSGEHSHPNLVWDSYNLTVDGQATGYDIKETSLLLPLTVNPSDALNMDVVLTQHTPLSLHVTVASPTNEPVDNATVRLYGVGGYDTPLDTGAYGQVFFPGLPQTGTYTVDVSAPGYTSTSQSVSVSQSDRIRINLASSS